MVLRTKFALLSGVLAAAAAAAVAGVAIRHEMRALDAELRERGASLARNLAAGADELIFSGDRLALATMAADVRERNVGVLYAFLVDADDAFLAHSDPGRFLGRRFVRPAAIPRAAAGAGRAREWDAPEGRAIDFSVAVVDRATRMRLGEAHVGLSPRVLSDARSAVGRGDFAVRVPVETRDELGELAGTFNAMTEGLRRAEDERLHKERMEHDLAVGREVQQLLIPARSPQVPGYDVAYLYRAAREVGGDYVDFLDEGRGRLGVVVADVSGKGVGGSLVMSSVRTALRLSARGGRSAAAVLARVNEITTPDMKNGMFVTAAYLVLDARRRSLEFARAGHNPVLLYRARDERTYALRPEGLPLGLQLSSSKRFARTMETQRLRLAKGDVLVAFTDGVTEAMDAHGRTYGESRLIAVVRRSARRRAQEILEALRADVAAFTGDALQSDDVTLVVIKERTSEEAMSGRLFRRVRDGIRRRRWSVARACRSVGAAPAAFRRWEASGGASAIPRRRAAARIPLLALEDHARGVVLLRGAPRLTARALWRAMSVRGDGRAPSAGAVRKAIKSLRAEARDGGGTGGGGLQA